MKGQAQTSVAVAFLEDWPSVAEALMSPSGLGSSRNQIKKEGLSKKFLQRKIVAKEILQLPINLLNLGEISPLYRGPPMEILFEDERILAINKWPGIFSHPLNYDEGEHGGHDNCLSYLRSIGRGAILLSVNQKAYDRGLLYRLDHETSGVLLYVKNQELWEEWRKEFHRVVALKQYLALVRGRCPLRGEYQHGLLPSRERGHKMKVVDASSLRSLRIGRVGKEGIFNVQSSHYIERWNLSLLQVELKTGLRHQVRAQLAALGYPLLGDPLYGGEKAPRMFLHAYRYDISWKGISYRFKCPQAPLFDRFLDLNRLL